MTRSESGFATGLDLGDESRGEERGLLTVGTSLMLNSTVRPTAAVIIIIHSFIQQQQPTGYIHTSLSPLTSRPRPSPLPCLASLVKMASRAEHLTEHSTERRPTINVSCEAPLKSLSQCPGPLQPPLILQLHPLSRQSFISSQTLLQPS